MQNVLRTLPQDAAGRKAAPIMSGVIDYFPLALLEVARISKAGNDQHNPGQPLHWSRGKSTDHVDCLARHLIERGTIDTDGQRHTAKAAWRVLALLQEELEAAAGWKPEVEATVEPTIEWPSEPGTVWEWTAADGHVGPDRYLVLYDSDAEGNAVLRNTTTGTRVYRTYALLKSAGGGGAHLGGKYTWRQIVLDEAKAA